MTLTGSHVITTQGGEGDVVAYQPPAQPNEQRRASSMATVRPELLAAPGIAGYEPNVVLDSPHDVVLQDPAGFTLTRDLHFPAEDEGISMFVPRATWTTTMERPRISIVIPTFNEAKNLPHVLARIPADMHEIIVVDGNSIDGTVDVARALRPDAKIVQQNRTGKGNAMACGFAVATGDILVMLDADGSADPEEIPLFVDALVQGADFAKGTRFAEGGGSADITRLRAWGNRWLNRITNVLYGTEYTDLCYGYNAFWRHCLDHLELDPRADETAHPLWGDGFEIETIINARVAKAALHITEVPSFEHARVFGQSNLNTWRDGLRVLRALILERCNKAGCRRNGRVQSLAAAEPAGATRAECRSPRGSGR